MPTDIGGAIAGTKVLEFAEGVPGPLCGFVLAQLGAEVTKFEPVAGDWLRSIPPAADTAGALFAALNHDKRSLVLDLRSDDGREAVAALAADADIIVVGYRAEKLTDLGISYEQLRRTNPALVYCQISGWGGSGPMASMPATELAVQSLVGMNRHLGDKDGDPVRIGYDLVSVNTGIVAAQACLAALLWRAESGEGQRVEVSMLGTALALSQWNIVVESGPEKKRGRPLEAYDDPPDHGFECREGHCLIDFRGDEDAWTRFFVAIGREDILSDERFNRVEALQMGGNKARLPQVVNSTIREWSYEELERLVRGELGGTLVPVPNLAELLNQEQVACLGVIADPESYALRLPWKSSEPLTRKAVGRVPGLGEHTAEILKPTAPK
jgi:crotonobetainyl-CoA:carnitine CoA-transferase CaiB-like acyl-CoA transferase